jgi:signal transduction histidine kinase
MRQCLISTNQIKSSNKIKPMRRYAPYIVIAYMMAAFLWWAVLLNRKNNDVFVLQQQIISQNNPTKNIAILPEIIAAEKKYTRQKKMIFLEGGVFIIGLILGIYFIQKAYRREMLAANQQRNFLLSITHELKSPLTAIRLSLETIQKRALSREQSENISKNALKEADRLSNLVNDLLMAAKIEAAYQPMKEPFNIAQVALDCVQRCQTRHPNAHFQTHISEKCLIVEADEAGMTSVLMNLLENAVKYSPENIAVGLSMSRIKNILHIGISDEGIGIPDNEKTKVFEKFYRVGNEDTRSTKGTGLGLYIVAQIVKAHNGKITIANNAPKGSIFKIEL